MARPKCLKPAYCLHKASGRAYVKIEGRRVYLGGHGTQASRDEYDRVIGEWIARGRQSMPAADCNAPASASLLVVEVVNAFRKHADSYYHAEGRPQGAGEAGNFKVALRPLIRLYGRLPAAEFSPLKFEAVMDEMVRLGWARTSVNRQAARVRHVFKWAAAKELVPASVYEALKTVPGLRHGKTPARESIPVEPVPDDVVDAVIPFLSRQVGAMLQLQRLTGARPGELWIMRPCDIDTRDQTLWEYRPSRHKTQHHGQDRVIHLGERCQQVLRPFLIPDRPTTAYLFSPAEARAEWDAARRTSSKTPMTPRQTARTPKPPPGHAPRDHYDKNSYRQAIERACDRAFPPPEHLARQRVPIRPGKRRTRPETPAEWQARLGADRWAELRAWLEGHRFHPHQVRHTVGTHLRRQYGLEAAQVILGHKTLKVTQVYAERNVEAARRVMSEVG